MPVIGTVPSLTLDRILLATDFSSASEAALVYAAALAKRFSSKLMIANVVDLSLSARSDNGVLGIPLDELRSTSAEGVEQIVAEVTGAGLKAEGKSVEGYNPSTRAIRLAEETDANLMIIGTNGRRGLSKFILGSFAQQVIHHALCPVLTIGPNVPRPEGKSVNFQTMVFATDLDHHTAQKAAVALAFAEDSMARIVLCHVVKRPEGDVTEALDKQLKTESALRKLIPNAAYDWCDPKSAVMYGDPAEAILRVAHDTGADLIVLGAHRVPAWFAHFLHGVACTVLEHATCPVMTICTD